MIYQPQLELLEYLRANGFKTFICSGGTVELMRVISQKYYGIPPEQVIGTEFKYKYVDSTGINDIMRLSGLRTFNDKQEKPVNIQYHIGKRPILACGNEGGAGDVYMLRFSQGNKYPSLQLIVNHDDSAREFYYQETDNRSLGLARKYNWTIISMKDDWKTVFVK
ncbi:haloacid dehalogenase-like hydrolase [Chitinophaga niastensis]|uniref:Haloacid dehalogenase-like hydrolase n=1 Tax=Chitinophaga niastensis TaxID=536980 RepID=A0A2P8HEW6_CHINA|nr:HAD family hydrolase [Chitinophaga niastensis]PSL44753.1 haloacid dehalogenase-like hydrolase [Chitinophaga niastensis]